MEQFKDSYATLVKSVSSATGHIVCVSVWGDRKNAAAYNAVIRAACDHERGTYVNITTLYGKGANRGPAGTVIGGETVDDFHPNTLGHQRIGHRILTAIGRPDT